MKQLFRLYTGQIKNSLTCSHVYCPKYDGRRFQHLFLNYSGLLMFCMCGLLFCMIHWEIIHKH